MEQHESCERFLSELSLMEEMEDYENLGKTLKKNDLSDVFKVFNINI